MGSSRKDVKRFPEDVKDEIGHALWLAQCGEKHITAKPLRGFGGATVLEIVDDFDTDTYRAVYTVRFEGVVFVLHCFQKKAKRGSETPRADMDLVRNRLKDAQELYRKLRQRGEV
jgi:phage-related protein